MKATHAFNESSDDGIQKKKRRLNERRDSLLPQRQELPIWAAQNAIIKLVADHRVLVIVGETGCGKTTQIPQFLQNMFEKTKGAIACTQPRRVAAMSVARRVAEEMGTELGHKVGYSVRFDDMSSPSTLIKYLTDGMLLREALMDPLLKKYKVVIVDEAHERTVQTDVLLGLLKQVLDKRDCDFRLIVMSATLDAAKFVTYLGASTAAYVQGRSYPISLFYTATPEESYMDAAFCAIIQVHHDEPAGDILVFLSGSDEIESLDRLLRDRAPAHKAGSNNALQLYAVTIYASMPPEQQMKVFEPAPEDHRKVILATNIAETSITIQGVRYVIDTGVVKSRGHNAKLGLDSLQVVPVSQAQARQRSGRAGREAAGKAYRLYTERTFDDLEPTTVPEIQRSNLGSVMLQLKAMGIQDVLNFDFMDPPPRASVIRSLELLLGLGALDKEGKLTDEVGLLLSQLPVEPMFGKVLLASSLMGCCLEALQVVSMVSAENIFFFPREKQEQANAARVKFISREGDHLTLLNVFRAYLEVPRKDKSRWCSENFINARSMSKAVDIHEQLKARFTSLGLACTSCGNNLDPVRKALTAGLFYHAASLQTDGVYKVITSGQQVWLHPSSTLRGRAKPSCIVFSELVQTTKQYAREVTAIEKSWLPDLVPGIFSATSKITKG
ncbi:hypothetical protein CEUSTIGMA_g8896.t1 [Chlamydomonas eustigma]|uniref:RNA helicase n=1 Tax=Chlamydomonas eustigma TaxID=1157962 RepID=A0A250XEF8_9CHLO|nr:hypothetical protein CEUSTIGMA_g8896.t1 [Chlamydomonas eustigma]|eukprot:GAX81467.1 hypothetical protein CEUSTIGMA_g8896.t1 [Chlamydomonas eustigma]